MIFFAFSWSTSLDQRSSVEIFFLSTSVPEIEIPFDDISWTIGPRGSVSETTLLHFGIRVDRRWNHPSILYLRLCTLGVERLFTSARRNLGDMRSGVCTGRCCCVSKYASNAAWTISLSLFVQAVYSRKMVFRWNFGKIGKKVNYTNRFRRSRNVLWTCKYICEKIFENCWKYLGGLRIFLEFSKIFLSLIREVQKMRVTKIGTMDIYQNLGSLG